MFEGGNLKVIDAVSKKQHVISKAAIKGFSLSKYPTRIWNFDEVIIYLSNGNKIELPQYLYWNFKEIKPAFESNGIPFLGFERFRWKFLDSRHYEFE